MRRTVLLVRTPALPSPGQRAAALLGTGFDPDDVETVALGELADRVAALAPDVVLVATRGPQARVLLRELGALHPRPVLVSGMPGISIPATRKALFFRAQAELFVVHSHREVREFAELSRAHGWDHRVTLAALPFARPGRVAAAEGTDLVFAVQSLVPAALEQRREVARMLLAAAAADPGRRVVVKVRARPGERQTHDERHPIPELVSEEAAGSTAPANLLVSDASMAAALDGAEGLVTVSSTAAVEAIARGVPVIALSSFGVADELINIVFVGSGLFGGADDVIARRFRHPEPGWLTANYFHPPGDDRLWSDVAELVAARRRGESPARSALPVAGGRMRLRWQRVRAFPGSGRGVADAAVLAVGVPAHAVLTGIRRAAAAIRRRRGDAQVVP
ncbi:hypothetical protein NUH29_13525 [Protaetiibacter sp. 10F1B-8-1]|uniref:Uncharacterized protein n=2 Tax=Protaetiibacter mangrovi TaxID=2970926 RepID=A0ABT1ZIP0_9MICO|nr:hypothetical protein [Protaetiibacter mangrovi]